MRYLFVAPAFPDRLAPLLGYLARQKCLALEPWTVATDRIELVYLERWIAAPETEVSFPVRRYVAISHEVKTAIDSLMTRDERLDWKLEATR